jgi:hypothetical protein
MVYIAALAIFLTNSFFQFYLISSTFINLTTSEMSFNQYSITSKLYETNEFLDRRSFNNKNEEIFRRLSSDVNPVVKNNQKENIAAESYYFGRKSSKRQFIEYKVQQIVHCLDLFSLRRNGSVYITFIGDSLVRNQFTNFISVSSIFYCAWGQFMYGPIYVWPTFFKNSIQQFCDLLINNEV